MLRVTNASIIINSATANAIDDFLGMACLLQTRHSGDVHPNKENFNVVTYACDW